MPVQSAARPAKTLASASPAARPAERRLSKETPDIHGATLSRFAAELRVEGLAGPSHVLEHAAAALPLAGSAALDLLEAINGHEGDVVLIVARPAASAP